MDLITPDRPDVVRRAVPLIDGRDQSSLAGSSSSTLQTPFVVLGTRGGVYGDGAAIIPMKMISSGPTAHASDTPKPAAPGGAATSVQPAGSRRLRAARTTLRTTACPASLRGGASALPAPPLGSATEAARPTS